MGLSSYRELLVWQKGIDLVLEIYKLTETFPREETYGLTSQMRRAAVSIPSNIAEGSRRTSRKDFRKFINDAFGSGAELETQVVIAKKLGFGQGADFATMDALLEEIMRMLNSLSRTLKA